MINYYISEVAKQYEEIVLKNITNDGYSFFKAIFEVCLIMKDVLQILYKQNLLDLFLANFEIIYEKYQHQFSKPQILEMENVDYIFAYERGGIKNMVKKWIAGDCTISPESMTKIFKQMVLLYKENM